MQQSVSTMSWEGVMLSGQQAIVAKLQLLPQVRHEYPTVDIQPSTSQNAMIIFVQGKLKVRRLLCSIANAMYANGMVEALTIRLCVRVLYGPQIEENPPILFTQVFQLVAHQPGQYYIHNDVFRLQYG